MSRIGKAPVNLPDKVEAKVTGTTVEVKGPKGVLTYTCLLYTSDAADE